MPYVPYGFNVWYILTRSIQLLRYILIIRCQGPWKFSWYNASCEKPCTWVWRWTDLHEQMPLCRWGWQTWQTWPTWPLNQNLSDEPDKLDRRYYVKTTPQLQRSRGPMAHPINQVFMIISIIIHSWGQKINIRTSLQGGLHRPVWDWIFAPSWSWSFILHLILDSDPDPSV